MTEQEMIERCEKCGFGYTETVVKRRYYGAELVWCLATRDGKKFEGYFWRGNESADEARLSVLVEVQAKRIAELESQLAFERERYELLAMDYAGADADRKAQPPAPDPSDMVRIAELESVVQHADKVVEQLTHDLDLERQGSYAATLRITQLTAERDVALDRLQKAREWLSDGHADLITLGGILRHD